MYTSMMTVISPVQFAFTLTTRSPRRQARPKGFWYHPMRHIYRT
jgi:hypothetical protein